MLRHLLYITLLAVLALTGMFYPFMPGRHDALAITLSVMAQALGFAGVLLVPIGALWLTYEVMKRRGDAAALPNQRGCWFELAALAGFSIVGAVVALAATLTGVSLGFVVIVLWGCIVWRTATALRLKNRDCMRINPAPFYLSVIPIVLVLARVLFLEAAVESSRQRAIAGSTEFIEAIEAYRDRHGRYPSSLASVHHDYDPPVVGVARYHYEPDGDSYNVYFEQLTYPIGTQEFVMYNPLDEHAMIVHNRDLLESPQEQVEGERRFHATAARDAGVPHWKYFWFD